MLVAVEETATGTAKANQGESTVTAQKPGADCIPGFTTRLVTFAAMTLFGAVPAISYAQVVAGGSHAPSVIQTPNGLQQVNINKPATAAGVSVNTYSQFNVPKAGIVLNNSSVLTNTQQAGYVNGNPNLAPGQSAKIIVNQVNSATASAINGYVEVAGPGAEVVVANPSGISVDGGGFINTSRAVLTTGTPNYAADGSLANFSVNSGTITVQGAGFNASNVPEVDLLARAVQINAALYANNLNVVTGSNQIDHDTLAATPIAGSGPAPGYSIDVSQLGGMYSGKIVLVGTEQGVGVSNAGVIAAQAGDLTLTSSGQLVQSGQMTASGNVSVNAASVASSGTIYAQQNTAITTAGALTNSGTLAAQQNTSINAASVASTGTLGAGVNNDGSVGNSGDLNVSTTGQINATGENVAGGNASLTGGGVSLAGSETAANGNLSLTASAGDLNLAGATTSAGGTVNALATGMLVNDRGTLSGGSSVTLAAGNLSNQGGEISAQGPLVAQASGQLTNQGGSLVSQSAMQLSGGAIANNQGTIQSAAGLSVAGASLDNTAGRITSLNDDGLSITTSGQLVNAAGTTSTGAQGGVIGGNGAVTLQGGNIANHGAVTAQTNLQVTGQSLDNSGGSLGASNLTLAIGSTLDNSSGDIEANQLVLSATDLLNHSGTITQYGASSMSVDVSNTLDNSNGGTLQTNSTDLTLAPATLDNDGGTITHAGTGTLTIAPGNGAGSISNVGGKIITAGQIAAQAGSLNNAGGVFAAQGNIAARVTGAVNNSQGSIRSLASLSLDSGDALTTTNGQIQSGTGAAGDVSTLMIQASSVDNTGGLVGNLGTGNTTVQGSSQIINSGGAITGNGDVAVNTSSLVNTQGAQLSGANIAVQAATVNNSSSKIGNLTGSTGDVEITATGTVTDTNGQIGATHDLTINATALTGGGAYSATNDVAANLQGNFAPTSDLQFNAGHDLTFTLPGTFNNSATLEAANNLGINAADIQNSGAMMAGGTLTTHSNTLENTGAIAGGSVSLNAAQSITNVGPTALIGATNSNGLLELLAPDIENRDDTTMTDTQATTAIYGLGKVVLAGGKDANGNYTNANTIRNQSALIQSAGDMTLDASQVTNTRTAVTTTGLNASVDPSLLTQLGISLSGCTAINIAACSGQDVGWTLSDNPAFLTMIGGVFTVPPNGGQWNSGYQYTTYTGVAVANLIATISPQAQIIAGGNLDASKVGLFQNDWSAVAAVGNIAAPTTLDQNSWQGQAAPEVQVTYSGQYHYNNYDNSEHDWQLPFGDAPFVGSNPGGYQAAPADIRTYTLPSYESTFVAGGTISGTGVSINNTAANAGLPSLGLVPGQSLVGVSVGGVSGSAGGASSIIASATAVNVLSHLTIPQGGLFKQDSAPNAPYLIETNPAFTSQKSFVSSDYYLQQLGLNPQTAEKRLGDGLYEQQLVQNQITSLTGKAVLGPYADTQSMYESLMTAGATLAQSLGLPLGASLSADQVAALKSNVVIMQTEVVDGQSVLVPVVYLAKASQQDMNGPLIAATDIDLQNAQTVNNSGTIQASNTLSIQGQQINNAFGTLQSGGLMSLTTTGNVDLSSATVNAGSLALNVGGNLDLSTAVNTVNQVSATGATRTTTTLGSIANLNVTGDASIITGGNFEQNAGNLNVGGSLGMAVGGNWDLGSEQTGEHKVVAGANGVSNTDINQTTGSNVNVGGVSEIGVGGNLTATGANINLGGGGIVVAKGDVTLQAATATSTVDSNSSGSDSHDSYASTVHTSDDALTATTLHSGNSLAIASGNDINVTGSTVELDKGAAVLQAAGNVNIGAATETHVSDSASTSSHSGVASHTGETDQVDQAATYADGSTVSADSVSIVSGKDINVIGSAIVGTNDVGLSAQGSVNIMAATDTWQDSEYHQVTHSGLSGSGGIGFSIGSSEQSDRYNGSSASESQSRSAVGSVQGNVSILAGQDVHIGGSDIVAGKAANDTTGATGNIGIEAQNITIDPSQDTAQSQDQQTSRSNGLTVGVTGTPLDTARNLQAASSSGNAYQRGTGVANEITASTLDTPSVSVSYGHSSSSSTTDMSSTSNAGSTVRGTGNVTLIATGGALKDANGNPLDGDITVTGSTVTAGGAATFAANRDVTLQASTDQTQQSTQSSSSSSSFSLASPSLGDLSRWVQGGPNSGGVSSSPYNAASSSANGNSASTQQTATVVTGNSVVVKSNIGDINVIGSGISGTQGVNLIATQGAINVLAGTNATTNDQESSSHQIGDLGSNGTGTGFSVGVASSHSVQDNAGQTQSTIRSQVVSQSGDVTLNANQDVTVQGSDLSAGNDLTLIGKDLNLDPGNDATQSSASQSSSQFGVTLALGGVAGSVAATINQAMSTQSNHTNDPRLAALDKAEAALSVYGDAQAAISGSDPALVKVTVSIGGGTSHSESQSTATTTDGSTLNAGGAATLIATGSGATDASGNATDGDINSVGTQITAQNVTLSATRDINLQSAENTTQNTSSNSSTSASIGVGASFGGTQNGFTVELAASGAKGNANGNSVTNENTQITAANTVSITSGRDTNLVGAEVSGNTVDANVGRNLTITSPQDTNTYNSQQSSAGFQASLCVPPICYGQTVSGSANASDQSIKDSFQSVGQQSGIVAGAGGFDVNVGNHTQLNGGVIASTATADKNTLSTQTFGYTNLQNTADYSGSTIGASFSGSSQSGSVPSTLSGGPQFSQTGNSASGTTYAAVSPGTITVRGDAGTGQDSTAGLSRDTTSANGSVQNTFNAQSVANNMAVQQEFGQLATFAVGQIADKLAANNPLFAEGGAGRDAMHAAVAAIGAAISGGNVAGAVGGSVAGDELQLLARPIINQAVSQLPADAQDAARIALNDIVASAGGALGGALAGGGSQGSTAGAGSAANNEVYNAQDDYEAQLTGEPSKSSNPFSQSPWVLFLQGLRNALSGIPGLGGGEPPTTSAQGVLANGAGQATDAVPGTPGYVPQTATLSSGGNNDSNSSNDGTSNSAEGSGSGSVTSPNTTMRANANASGTYVDPLTGLVVPADGTLAADHIVPQSWIKQLPGFDQLTPAQQSALLNDPVNTQGLPTTFNSSKGAQMPGDWTTYKGQPLNSGYVQNGAAQAATLQNYILNQISSMLGK